MIVKSSPSERIFDCMVNVEQIVNGCAGCARGNLTRLPLRKAAALSSDNATRSGLGTISPFPHQLLLESRGQETRRAKNSDGAKIVRSCMEAERTESGKSTRTRWRPSWLGVLTFIGALAAGWLVGAGCASAHKEPNLSLVTQAWDTIEQNYVDQSALDSRS